MKIDFTISVLLCGSMIILGLFASIILWFRKENRLSNRFLALLLLAFSLWLIHTFYSISGIYAQDPNFYFRPIYYSFAFGPLIYFYVRSITNNEFQFKAIYYLHFIPVLFQASLYLFLFFQTYNYKNWYWQNVHYPYTYKIEFDGTFLSLAIYLGFSIYLLIKYQKWIINNYSESSKIKLNRLKLILALFLLLCLFWFLEVILRTFYTQYSDFTILLMGILILLLALLGINQKDLGHINFNNADHPKKTKITEIDPQVIDTILSRMKEEKDYLNPALTLKEFAHNCKYPSRVISEHINHGLKKTFHDFVNEYRVQEVVNILKSEDKNHYTIESIAYDAGFNSKATFNRIFKKVVGVAPSQFKKSL